MALENITLNQVLTIINASLALEEGQISSDKKLSDYSSNLGREDVVDILFKIGINEYHTLIKDGGIFTQKGVTTLDQIACTVPAFKTKIADLKETGDITGFYKFTAKDFEIFANAYKEVQPVNHTNNLKYA